MRRGSRPPRNPSAERAQHRRAERRAGLGPEGYERASIAQTAARLIAEHGIADWTLAKRKAAHQLGLPDRAALPADEEIESALRDYHAIFGGDAYEARLRAQREEALDWMKRLAAFRPLLVGGVAEGWATDYSDIRIELVADDAKTVELALLNAGLSYRALPSRNGDGSAELYVDTRRGGVRLTVRTPQAARQRPRRDRRGQDELRLDSESLEALIRGSA